MAFDPNKNAQGFDNAAIQDKLAVWWNGLLAKDREKVLASIKTDKTLKGVLWDDLDTLIQSKLFQAGTMMARLVKGFPA